MNHKSKFLAAALMAFATLAVSAAPSSARQDDIMSHIMGQPSLAWNVIGLRRPARARPAAEVPGGQAVRIEAKQSANQWDISAGMPVTGDIHAGDVLMLAVWARVETPPEGQTTARLPAVMIQQNAAPYSPVISGGVNLTSEWKLHFVTGTSPVDRPNGNAGVTIHLANANQTIDLGPAFVFNLGQGYDVSKLPANE
ncbi:hypothetical protein ASG17_10750 [Brevundimonas sp. Leaf363]|uniref:hypothetical protein n=1 Tax=Brevundimonas sp. Leaf363 TaxID=1736353 RepID=UPI0006F1E4A8|nr:hypothetical protein [Brevundimonas sp. Leaf363]KQS56459.1 hypothetical protein ASG17_10750 [Brevundimonas sp. Leaf363]